MTDAAIPEAEPAHGAVAAVVVSYNPPAGFGRRLSAVAAQTDYVIVVDNGSAPEFRNRLATLSGRPRTEVLANGANRGIAAALNQGIAAARARGCRWALLLDHDSEPEPGMVAALLAEPVSPDIAALAPRIVYPLPGIRCRWPRTDKPGSAWFRFIYADAQESRCDVDLAISSGLLLNVTAHEQLGGFREDLFIDLVDTEYCLRARRNGLRIVAVPAARLRHELGRVERRRLPGLPAMYPTHHDVARHYYIARNRVLLGRAHAATHPSWLLYELAAAVKLTVKVVLFEHQRLRKLRAMASGTVDGLRGRSGASERF